MFEELGSGESLESARARYLEAQKLAKAGNWSAFDRVRADLERYPLTPYLDYKRLLRRLVVTSGVEARAFVDAHSDNPLGVRLLGSYLHTAGKRRRWGDYLDAATEEPRSEALRCYFARAKRARGDAQEAWTLASRLWLSASSVDESCDPLFDEWRKAGGLNDDLVWKRARLVYAAREGSLLRYVASLGSEELQPALAVLRESYRQPQRSVALSQTLSNDARKDVLTLGLERYSRYDPARALEQWLLLDSSELNAAQRQRVESAIAFRGLLEREASVRDWADTRLHIWSDDKLTQLRLRWAIADEDWAAIDAAFPALSETEQSSDTWRYWYARAIEASGRNADAKTLYAEVARERSYYGFLSADRLGLPYSYQQSPIAGVADGAENLPVSIKEGLWRVHELNAIGEEGLAHTEWSYILRRLDPPQQLALARVAQTEGWHRLSIDGANASEQWGALDLRFPLAYLDDFHQRAAAQSLPVSELMAIARRESAFLPTARSSVGARGLMQLMPATGRSMARKIGLPVSSSKLDNVEYNLTLGSTYYRQLLERFAGNRPVALAAYNAGPNRVKNWLDTKLPQDVWIETIPYRETRNYVKAVLAYSVIFDYRLGEKAQLMTTTEP